MLSRNIKITFRLNCAENERFKRKVKKSGLSKEAYIRHLVDDLVPTDAPPPDYYTMVRELHAIGTNLNQVAQKAHMLNVIDTKQYYENVAVLHRAIIEITNAVMLPRKMERKDMGFLRCRSCGKKEQPRNGELFGESDKRRAL
jgi:hypothetical protein